MRTRVRSAGPRAALRSGSAAIDEHGQIVLTDIPHVEATQAALFRPVEEEQRRLERNDRNQP